MYRKHIWAFAITTVTLLTVAAISDRYPKIANDRLEEICYNADVLSQEQFNLWLKSQENPRCIK